MNSIYAEAAALCAAGEPFVWASIISQDGSTPRSAGSKMLILQDRIFATIGGGGMEAEVIAESRSRVMADGLPRIYRYDMSGAEASALGLICGGVCEVMLARCDSSLQPVFAAAAEAETAGTPAWLFYILDEQPNAAHPFRLCVNVNGEKLVGEYEGHSKFARDMLLSPIRVAVHGDSVDGVRYLVDDVGSAPRMLLFGAGHVSCEVARIALSCGFRVLVIDDREDYCNQTRFPDCECLVVEDLAQLPALPVDQNSYVVIMTRGHAFDRDVLRWALGKKPYYLGMIGSKSKRDALYKKLNAEGYDMADLLAVKCPIGLGIYAETPAEIAVSVMAEIIAERRKPQN